MRASTSAADGEAGDVGRYRPGALRVPGVGQHLRQGGGEVGRGRTSVDREPGALLVETRSALCIWSANSGTATNGRPRLKAATVVPLPMWDTTASHDIATSCGT